jgi:DHA2 family multidrug resistance protein
MTGWTPDLSQRQLVITIVVQGAGLGFVFIPLQVLAFTNLAPELRGDGTALLSLVRNVGSSIGISVCSAMLAHNRQVNHAELGAMITPFTRVLQGGEIGRLLNLHTAAGVQLLDRLINQQADIIGYIDDYKMMLIVTLPTVLLLLLMRADHHARGGKEREHIAAME